MQEHAGAARCGWGAAFEVRDVVTLPPQLDCCGDAPHPVTGHGDPQWGCHFTAA
jgi:hypothetical protein